MEGNLINTHPTSSSSNDISSSPWEDDLPEETKAAKPKIVGSLEPKDEKEVLEEKPSTFNIPENVGEEKVGNKISAEDVFNKSNITNDSEAPDAPEEITPAPRPVQEASQETTPAVQTSASSSSQVRESGVGELINNLATPSVGSGLNQAGPGTSEPEIKPSSKMNDIVSPKEQSPYATLNIPPKEEAVTDSTGIHNENIRPENQEASALPKKKTEKKKGLIGRIFSRGDQVPRTKEEKITPKPETVLRPTQTAVSPLKKMVEDQTVDKKSGGLFAFLKSPSVTIAATIIIIVGFGIYLTELGFVSFGMEKFYGTLGLESLWGGLPKDAEKALALSASSMVDDMNFKINGSISLTVNKSIESPITSPLISMISIPVAIEGQNFNIVQRARLAVSDYGDYYDYYNSGSSSSSSSNSGSSSSSSTTNNSTSQGDQSDQQSYTEPQSTIKEIEADFEGESSQKSSKLNFTLKKLIGLNENIDLINTENNLYVKSSQKIKFDEKADPNKWLMYSFSNIENDNALIDFISLNYDKGASVTGRRVGNEKIGGIRCFKYEIDSIEIGDSLAEVGVNKDMIQKISGTVWIGVKDKKIRRVEASVVPSVSSSISRFDINLDLSEIGKENSILIPSLSEVIAISKAPTATTSTPTPSNDQKRKNDLQAIKTALDDYKNKHGSYPLSSNFDKLNNLSSPVRAALVSGYINTIPDDPKSSEGWYYGYKSDGSSFTLSARIEDASDSDVVKVGDIYLYYLKN